MMSYHGQILVNRFMYMLYRLNLRPFIVGHSPTWDQYNRWLDDLDTWSNP